MILKDKMVLFHGSYSRVEKISLDKCSSGKDFGRGFYLTSDLKQARDFVKLSLRKACTTGDAPATQDYGYVSSFQYSVPECSNLNIHIFDKADRDWLWFVAQNRREYLSDKIRKLIDPEILCSDIIVGKIANDTTNPVITAYLNGLYGDILSDEAINFAIKQLMPEHLVDQYCFLSEKSITCLRFLEAARYDV